MMTNKQNTQYIDQSLKASTKIDNRNYKNSATSLTTKNYPAFKILRSS